MQLYCLFNYHDSISNIVFPYLVFYAYFSIHLNSYTMRTLHSKSITPNFNEKYLSFVCSKKYYTFFIIHPYMYTDFESIRLTFQVF